MSKVLEFFGTSTRTTKKVDWNATCEGQRCPCSWCDVVRAVKALPEPLNEPNAEGLLFQFMEQAHRVDLVQLKKLARIAQKILTRLTGQKYTLEEAERAIEF